MQKQPVELQVCCQCNKPAKWQYLDGEYEDDFLCDECMNDDECEAVVPVKGWVFHIHGIPVVEDDDTFIKIKSNKKIDYED